MSASATLADPIADTLVLPGETCQRSLRLSREDIAAFARLSGDSNPLHHHLLAAQRARHGEILASGQHTTALMMGLAASHFSRAAEAGVGREVLCLNFNFSFKAPVFADQPLDLFWRVASVEWHERLGGLLVQIDGRVAVRHAAPAVVGRGTLLVKAVPA